MRRFMFLVVCCAAPTLAEQLATIGPLAGGDDPDGSPPTRMQIDAGAVGLDRTPQGRGPQFALSSGLIPNAVPPEGDTPTDVAFTPDGLRFIIAHRDSQNLTVFDAATRTVVDTIALSGSPHALAVSSDGVHAVTANVFEDTVSIADLTTGLETDTIPVGASPGVVRITPDGTTAVVGNTSDSSVSIIDIAAASELRRVTNATFTRGGSVAPEPGVFLHLFSEFELAGDDTIVHADYSNNRILLIDIDTGAVTALPSLNQPRSLDVTPDGTTAVVVHFTQTSISVVDIPGAAITKTINVGATLFGDIAISHDGTKACVDTQNNVRFVNLVTDAVGPNIFTGGVSELHTTAQGFSVVAVGFNGALLSWGTDSLVSFLNTVVSPTTGAVTPAEDFRAVMVGSTFNEDLVVVNTYTAGFQEGTAPSGPPLEADKTRKLAVTPDGSKAVTSNILSDNASIIDLASGAVEAVLPVGDRPADVEITPDGSQAVIANLDAPFVSIIDIAGHTVTNVNTSTRNSEVEISPDGQFAYVAVVVSDGVWRINLDTLTVQGAKLPVGEMGGISYAFSQASGLTLSHDGATLVACNSFHDTISVIDTASWAVVATVPVGALPGANDDFPVRATFSADDSTLYVSNRNSSRVAIVNVAGAASTTTGFINVGGWPWETVLSADESKLYVPNVLDDNIGVVPLPGTVMTTTIPLPESPVAMALNASGDRLLVASGTWSVTFGATITLNLFGQFSTIDTTTDTLDEQVDFGLPPADLRYDAANDRAVVAAPFGDGLQVFNLSPCPGDLDGDSAVTIGDLAIQLSNFGTTSGAAPEDGDLDGDGDVDLTDLATLLSVFGSICS